MNETKQDIERRTRLQEWFKSDPEIWMDLLEEFKNCHHNEMTQLKSRGCSNKEWSSGYVNALEEVINLQPWLRKKWTPPSLQQK